LYILCNEEAARSSPPAYEALFCGGAGAPQNEGRGRAADGSFINKWYLAIMKPFASGLYKTLHLLVMLHRANKQKVPSVSAEEAATIRISRQILTDAGLTVPELANYLRWLADKGYLLHIVVFDNHVRKQIDETMSGKNGAKINKALQEKEEANESKEFDSAVIEFIKPKLPPGKELDENMVYEEKFKPSELSKDGYSMFKKLRPDEIALVVILPFREIERLHERIGDGEEPKDIKDEGTWYDADEHIFHLGEETIATSYNGKKNTEHYVLVKFEEGRKTGKIHFDEIDGFRPETLRQAMYRFVEKNDRLNNIFKVRTNRVEVFTGLLE